MKEAPMGTTTTDDAIERLRELADGAALSEPDGSWMTGNLREFGRSCSPEALARILDVVAAAAREIHEVGINDLCSGLSITEYGCAGCPAHDMDRNLRWLRANLFTRP